MIDYNNNSRLDKNGYPTKPGVYLLSLDFGEWKEEREVDVYEHPIKGLCCFFDDVYAAGTGVDDETDCHIPVQCIGFEFIKKIEELD